MSDGFGLSLLFDVASGCCAFQIGEEMSQNSFIKQYLAKQQELLRQRLEREAREAAETDGKMHTPEDCNRLHTCVCVCLCWYMPI